MQLWLEVEPSKERASSCSDVVATLSGVMCGEFVYAMKFTEGAEPVKESFIEESERLYIFFGGIVGGLGMPPFEFFESSGLLGQSRVFLRDFAQSWYQTGLPGVGPDIGSVVEFLRSSIDRSKAKEVVFVGNSMGGFAALMFCSLLGQGRVVAFSPQTVIDEQSRKRLSDRRWDAQLKRLHDNPSSGHILNLPDHFRLNRKDIRADIHVSDPLDLLHARELLVFPNIRVHEYAEGGHSLVAKLRDQGRLFKVLA